MLSHILSVFVRFVKTSGFQFSTIVVGLSTSMCVSMLIFTYVREESRYDDHHARADRMFRVNTTLVMDGKADATAKAGLNTGTALIDFYPEIESATQILNISKQTIKVGEDLYSTEKAAYADSTFFQFFDYRFISGSPRDALTGPNKVVISRALARQYFKDEMKAYGAVINVNNSNYQVTGVFDEGFGITHVPYEVFLSLSSLPKSFLDARNREFMWLTTYNYICLRPGADPADLQARFSGFNDKFLIPYAKKNEVNGSITHQLQAVTDIHRNPNLRFDFAGAVSPQYLAIFSGVALLTLFIAMTNYVNLTTAQVSRRLKEIGIRKSVGATRGALFFQFLFETVLTVAGSFILAIVLFILFLPELNRLAGKIIPPASIFTVDFVVGAVIFVVAFGCIAGAYPAVLLSSFRPVQALQSGKGSVGASVMQSIFNPGFVRKVLVTLQFSISVFLIIGTIILYRQFNYMRSYDMGFTRDQVMVIDIPNDTLVSNNLGVIREKLAGIAAIKSVSATASIPGGYHGALTMNVSQSGGSEIKVINTYFADDQFMDALDLELVEGRFFSKEFSTDPQQAFVINEAAADFLGWDEPLNKKVVSPLGQNGVVVGVIKDFNYKSLHMSIEPLIIMNTPNSQGFLLVRMFSENVHATIELVHNTWREFDSSHPYDYFFLDEKFQAQYVKEQRLSAIFSYFSVLAIFISCLGLVGLAIFTNELKTREIAIRKTLGANQLHVIRLLSKDFLSLVVLANVLAWPLSYFFVKDWLSDFAYQVNVDVFPFLYGMLAAFAIAFLTVFYFARKAARQDIVRALKQV